MGYPDFINGGDYMHIQPESVVELYKGIECDANYKNTYWFTTTSQQNTWFNNKSHTTFQHLSFQRLYKNVVRINAHLGDVYNVNYMRFQNPTFGGKWFYAFVLKCDYVNAETVDVFYKIDEIQTWLPYIDLSEKQYMLRMHDRYDYLCTDSAHANLVNTEDEPVDATDVCTLQGISPNEMTRNIKIVLGYTKNGLTSAESLEMGSFNCCKFDVQNFNQEGITSILTKFNEFVANDSVSSVVGCWIIPSYAFPNPLGDGEIIDFNCNREFKDYIPKNNKLYSYPYNYLVVDSGSDKKSYRFENFTATTGIDNSKIGVFQFRLTGTFSLKPEAWLEPLNYENFNTVGGNTHTNDATSFGLLMTDFPMVALSIDSVAAASAQLNSTLYSTMWDIGKGVANVMNAIPGVGGGPTMTLLNGVNSITRQGQATTGGVTGGAQNLIGAVEGIMDSLIPRMENTANTLRKSGELFGIQANNSVLFYNDKKNYHFYRVGLSPRSAQRVDDFFSKYGYAQNKALPLTDVEHRSAFCYVQTQNANLSGNVPADSLVEIENALNNGVWFWRDKDHVGQYDITNSIV